MTLDIGEAIRDGVDRTMQRNAAMLVGALFLLNLSSSFLGLRMEAMTGDGAAMSASLSLVAGALIASAAVMVLSFLILIVAIRTFVGDETETIPRDYLHRDMTRTLGHTIIGSIAFLIVVGAGFMLFLVPGIYLFLALMFWVFFVAVEDMGALEAMQESWEFTTGHKWDLYGFGLILLTILLVLALPTFALDAEAMPGIVTTSLLSAVTNVFLLAVTSQAFIQLRE